MVRTPACLARRDSGAGGQRPFAVDVLASGDSGANPLFVLRRSRQNHHQIDVGMIHQLVQGFGHMGNAQVRCGDLCSVQTLAVNGSDFVLGQQLEHANVTVHGPVANTDQTDADRGSSRAHDKLQRLSGQASKSRE
jgi:hypothetical protein